MADGRRVVQVQAYCAAHLEADVRTYSEQIVVALCDDGSVWRMGEYGPGWQRLPEIPQDG